MATISEIMKAVGLEDKYTGTVTTLLKNSHEYGEKIKVDIMGQLSVDEPLFEIASFVEEEIKKIDISEDQNSSHTNYFNNLYANANYILQGSRGRKMWVFEDKCIIKVDITAGSFLTGNLTDGVKTIFYKDVIGIQYKESGALIGYLQLETASGMMNNNSSNFFNENTFTFDSNKLGALIRTVYEFICDRVSLYKTLPVSAADEIRKFREFLQCSHC